ncbi:hypothetical protein INR49_010418 [Caranx melampygus]|nr:hypothetical protein INR49_010418 [Caranx melampygus]
MNSHCPCSNNKEVVGAARLRVKPSECAAHINSRRLPTAPPSMSEAFGENNQKIIKDNKQNVIVLSCGLTREHQRGPNR